jgi:hypothetical protein
MPKDLVFLETFPCGLGIFDDITSATMEQAMIPSRGAVSQISPFYQEATNLAHGEIAQDAGAGGTTTDHKDVCVEVYHSTTSGENRGFFKS